jgi:hypothetical protein
MNARVKQVAATQPTPEEIERAIRQIGAGPPEEAIPGLTLLANRAIIELHRVSREQANQRRGQPDWGKWARLANAIRSGVLQVAAIRDSVKGLDLGSKAAAADAGPQPSESPDDESGDIEDEMSKGEHS